MRLEIWGDHQIEVILYLEDVNETATHAAVRVFYKAVVDGIDLVLSRASDPVPLFTEAWIHLGQFQIRRDQIDFIRIDLFRSTTHYEWRDDVITERPR